MTIGEVIMRYSRKPFSYGADCCQFVGECLESIGKYNPMRELEYGSEREAYEIIESHGTLADAITHYFGDPIPVDDARPGDVVVAESGGRQLAGIAVLTHEPRMVVRTEKGVTDWSLGRALFAWRPVCRKQ